MFKIVSFDSLPFFLQGAVTATFQALRHASPVAPTLGNIGQSDLGKKYAFKR